MFIELVELLRCTREHEESWLVAQIDELHERSIATGKLGCPVCSAEYPIVNGVADFSNGAVTPRGTQENLDAAGVALRAGAFLGLGESSGVVLLGGSWALGASALAQSLDVRVFAANGAAGSEALGVGRISMTNGIPLRAASCAGVALDETFSDSAFAAAARAVRPGGRVVGPTSQPLPDGLSLLAKDSDWWVAEKPPEVTTLRRGSR